MHDQARLNQIVQPAGINFSVYPKLLFQSSYGNTVANRLVIGAWRYGNANGYTSPPYSTLNATAVSILRIIISGTFAIITSGAHCYY